MAKLTVLVLPWQRPFPASWKPVVNKIILRPPWKARPHEEMRWDVEKKKREGSRSRDVPDRWESDWELPALRNLRMAPAPATTVCSFMTYSKQDHPAEPRYPTEPEEIRISCYLKPLHWVVGKVVVVVRKQWIPVTELNTNHQHNSVIKK